MILEKIDSPKNLKSLSLAELKTLAQEIREYMLAVLSEHPGILRQTSERLSLPSRCITFSIRRATGSSGISGTKRILTSC